MTKDDIFKIGMALWRIAQMLDDETFNRIKPSLDEIQDIVLKEQEQIDDVQNKV